MLYSIMYCRILLYVFIGKHILPWAAYAPLFLYYSSTKTQVYMKDLI